MIRTALELSRRVTAVVAVLLLLSPTVGEALGHACPHHGPGGAVHAAGEGAAAPAESHHAEVDHGDRAGASEPAGHEGPCTCIGTCEAGSLTVLPAGSAGVLAFSSHTVAGPTPPEVVRRARLPAHFLPYSQAPPPSC